MIKFVCDIVIRRQFLSLVLDLLGNIISMLLSQ